MRLDKALAVHPLIGSRSQALKLISAGHVRLLDKVLKPSYKTAKDENYTIQIQLQVATELVPYSFKLDVIFEDSSLLVINKPSGLVVHPAAGHHSDTLVNALIHYTKDLSSGFEAGRPGLVHRLDKDTSGLIVIAKNDEAHRKLALQFKEKTSHRVYWAVTYGLFQKTQGTISSYLARHPKDRKKFISFLSPTASSQRGRRAVTHYCVKKTHASGLTLVHCQLETGRTHQIRVHMAEQRHPIVGDPIYCKSSKLNSFSSSKIKAALKNVPHLMLHAAELGFVHPKTNKKIFFQVGWPDETHAFLKALHFL